MAKNTFNILKGMPGIHDVVLLSGVLFTLAENIAVYYYIVYFPYWIMKQGIRLLSYSVIAAFLVLILYQMVYLKLDNDSDLAEVNASTDEKIERGIGMARDFLSHTFS